MSVFFFFFLSSVPYGVGYHVCPQSSISGAFDDFWCRCSPEPQHQTVQNFLSWSSSASPAIHLACRHDVFHLTSSHDVSKECGLSASDIMSCVSVMIYFFAKILPVGCNFFL